MDIDNMGFHTLRGERAEKLARNLFTGNNSIIRAGTIILTKACNLDCKYCNSKERKGKSFTYDELESIITEWKNHGCEFIHFTGGEATLFSCLPEIVKYASSLGIKTSLTSNGTAKPELYQRLVENGLINARISLDFNSGMADYYSGRIGTFDRVLGSIKAIVEKRDEIKNGFSLTINTCVWQENITLLPSLIKDLLALDVDDIKLMPVRQWRDELISKYKKEYETRILPDILKIIPKNKYPLLHFRLPNLLTEKVSGFKVNSMPKRCYLMLEERCIDYENYYPCFIYYQESGQPIGQRTDSLREQHVKMIAFALQQSVKCDTCYNNCADATGMFNYHVEKLLEGMK